MKSAPPTELPVLPPNKMYRIRPKTRLGRNATPAKTTPRAIPIILDGPDNM